MSTIAIVGSHSMSRKTAPFDDPSVDIWVFNAVAGLHNTWVTRCNAVFQMHRPEVYKSEKNREDPYHWRWLQQVHPFPIYMQEVDLLVPSSVKYPIDEIHDLLLRGWTVNGRNEPYFSSSIDYAVALAIYQGYEHIELHGIEMASNTEYVYQRTGLAFWEGVAIGRGIEVEHYGGSEIFNRPLYGYQGNLRMDGDALAARVEELSAGLAKSQSMNRRAEMQVETEWRKEGLAGAIGVLRETRKRLGWFEGALEAAETQLYKYRSIMAAGDVAYLDRNEYEEAAYTAQKDCDTHDRLMKESAGKVDVALQSWVNSGDPQVLKHLKQFVYEHAGHAQNLGKANGIMVENLRLMKETDKAITASGGQKALDMVKEEA